MTRRTKQRKSWQGRWLPRLVRGVRPDRNPLRRRSDRAESAIAAGLLAAFLAGAPFTAVTAGHWEHAAAVHEQRTQQAAWHQVPAVLEHTAPPDTFAGYGPSTASVQARWTAPDGSRHSGYISVAPGTRAGTTVRAWTDESGKLTGPPLQPTQVADRAALAAMVAPMVPGILLLAAWKLARRELDRRRAAAWASDWRATGPQWTSMR